VPTSILNCLSPCRSLSRSSSTLARIAAEILSESLVPLDVDTPPVAASSDGMATLIFRPSEGPLERRCIWRSFAFSTRQVRTLC